MNKEPVAGEFRKNLFRSEVVASSANYMYGSVRIMQMRWIAVVVTCAGLIMVALIGLLVQGSYETKRRATGVIGGDSRCVAGLDVHAGAKRLLPGRSVILFLPSSDVGVIAVGMPVSVKLPEKRGASRLGEIISIDNWLVEKPELNVTYADDCKSLHRLSYERPGRFIRVYVELRAGDPKTALDPQWLAEGREVWAEYGNAKKPLWKHIFHQ